MILLRNITLMAAALCTATSFAATVNSTFVGSDPNHPEYSDPQNWSPAEVPNNSASNSYNVSVAANHLLVDENATISNLSLTGITTLSVAGHDLTVAGMTTNSILPEPPNPGLLTGIYVFSTSAREATFDAGNLSNFSNGTLTGHRYAVFGSQGKSATLQFTGANIERNGGTIELDGGLGRIVDENGADALRNFRENLPGATFSLSDQSFSTGANFTNGGVLSVLGISSVTTFTISGMLTNFDASSRTLMGGTYEIGFSPNTSISRLVFTAADIVHNSASLSLKGNAAMADENGNDGLRNFSDNNIAGSFTIIDGHDFTAASDFTNSGTVQIVSVEGSIAHFAMAGSHHYMQSAGETNLQGGIFSGDMQINGGSLRGGRAGPAGPDARIVGDVTIGNATLEPISLSIDGHLTFSAGSHLRIGIGSWSASFALLTVTLGGTLDIEVLPDFFPASNDRFFIFGANTFSGSFTNAPNSGRVTTADGHASFKVTYSAVDHTVFLSDYETIPPAAQLLNISARAQVLGGERVLIGGFVIFGNDPKKVIIRGIGPSLANDGITNALQDPALELHDSHGVLFASNDDWKDNQEAQIRATTIPPNDDHEAAIVATLQPGAYTAVLRGKDNTTGVALVEIYDLASQSDSKVANLSARGFVDAANVLIAGIIAGGQSGNTDVVFRAIGPDLAQSGIQNALPDPTLDIRDANGMSVAFNDDQYVSPAFSGGPIRYGESDKDALIRVSLAPGRYTAVLQSKTGEGGVAVVESYDLHR